MSPSDEIWKERRHFILSIMRNFVTGKPNFESMIKEEVEKVLEVVGEFSGRPFDPDDLLHSGVTNVRARRDMTCQLILGKRFDYEHPDYVDLLALMHSLLEENNVSPLSPFIIVDRVAPLIARSSEMKKVREKFLKFLLFLKREIAQLRSEFNYNQEPISMVQAYFKMQRDFGADSLFFDDGLFLDAAFSLFFGGDAVANNMRWAIIYLCRNPELQEEIYQEILTQTGSSAVPNNADRIKLPLTEAAIMEVQRASGQHLGVLRRTVSASKLFGYDIPKDTIIVSLLGACLLDPHVFPNPREFDHKRFLENGNNKEEHKKRLAHFLPFQLVNLTKKVTVDGNEETCQANHLSHFLLTNLLLNRIIESGPGSRIVNVTSRGHTYVTEFDVTDLNSEKRPYPTAGIHAYSYSKFENVLFTQELARRLHGKGVTSNSVHPGVVRTDFMSNVPLYHPFRMVSLIMMPFGKTAMDGAQTIIFLSVADDVANINGHYFVDSKPIITTMLSLDEKIASDLWDESARLTFLAK